MWKISISITFLILILLCVCEESYDSQKFCGKTDAILFKEKGKSHRMVEIEFSNLTIKDCFIYGDNQLAQKKIMQKLCQPKVNFVSRKSLSKWIFKCSNWLLEHIEKKQILKYSDPNFPDEYNNKIDRNFFEGIMVN